MPAPKELRKSVGKRRSVRLLPLLLVIVSLACALPFVNTPEPTATRWVPSATPTTPPMPTATPLPLPPALVESDPPESAELPLNGPITLYFNQSMDRASVEAALSSQMGPGLGFTWLDDATVVVTLSSPLQPDTELNLLVSDAIRSSTGKPLFQTVSLEYRTAGFLALSLALPEPGAAAIDPTSAVVAAFNRPIVALGSASPADLPAAFTLEPAAPGRGEWLNTSTYIFYPDPALAGGQPYTVHLNPDLKSVDGGPLQSADDWSFTTARPEVLSLTPSTETPWPLDPDVTIRFNQPMDTDAIESAFRLADPAGNPVSGQVEWREADTVFTFTPDTLLERNTGYTVELGSQAQGLGGSPLAQSLSAGIVTVAPLQLVNAEPLSGGQMAPDDSPVLYFSAPLDGDDVEQHITLDPAVSDLYPFWDSSQNLLRLNGTFAPHTTYTLRLAPTLTDRWGAPLGQEVAYTFTTTGYNPNLVLIAPSRTIFLSAQEASLVVQAVGLENVPMSVGPLSMGEFVQMNGIDGYEQMQGLLTRSATTWSQPIALSTDRIQPVELPLSPDGAPLAPGIYFLRFNFEQTPGAFDTNIDNGPFLLVVGDVQLTFKAGAADTLVWAAGLQTNASAANLPIQILDEAGAVLAQGQTDAQGLFTAAYPPRENSYDTLYAVAGQPGSPNFGLSLTSWSSGIEAWDFGLPTGGAQSGIHTYFYTDRPIYRPGQTVYFRAVVRQAFNGRYTPPETNRLPVTIHGNDGQEIIALELPISAMGTAHGEFTIPSDAAPGYFNLATSLGQGGNLGFQVAAYRKPEINLEVGFDNAPAHAGDPLTATVNTRYFFDAPAGDLAVSWVLYRQPAYFSLPGYSVGREDTSWLDAFRLPPGYPVFGEQVDSGEARTGADGRLQLEFPTEPADVLREYRLEVTVTDESGLPVSGRGSIWVHPDEFYIGLRPDQWVGQAGVAAGFEIQVVDAGKQPAGARNLRASFRKVVWQRIEPPPGDLYGLPEFEPQYTPIGSTDFVTGDDGRARLAFTPPDPGTYMLDVFNLQSPEGEGARSQFLLWVGGAGQAVWPSLPNARLQLVADRDAYQPGDTAQVFIPNPFGREVSALVTLERSLVLHHEVVAIGAQGHTLALPLTGEHAPNVYLSVTLLGSSPQGHPDFRQGYLNLPVAPVEQTLQVTLTGQPERAGPGDPVTFEIQVTDAAGEPVQGEFSLSVVDLAVLALADPNSEDIVSAFYDQQPLGVRTSLALAAYNRRQVNLPGGMGGGGGADVTQVARENFPDTAYWNAEIVTNADGRATVSLDLPDTLTTWQVETRGLTLDTRVGQAETQVVATKELLVRPVTPRFLVANDRVELAAIVQNNTAQELPVEVALQATGFALDGDSPATQSATVPANGRARLAWWGVAQDVDTVDLVFSASGGGLQDVTRPAVGALPVLRYFTPQTFRTSGVLDAAGELTELVSLPRSFDPQSGRLSVELSPTLAAAMLRALDVLETYPYASTEQVLSSFLPNLEMYRTLQDFGIDDDALQARLDRNLNTGLQRLQGRQIYDGGWAWWQGGGSDPYVTSYVLYGLLRARQAGITINQSVIDKAIEYLKAPAGGDPSAESDFFTPTQPYAWDRLAFQQFVLSEAGSADPGHLDRLVATRDQLSPWAQALLALTLERERPGAPEVQTLLSDLQSGAVRSATGAFWEFRQDESGRVAAGRNMHSDLSNTAIVLFALAQRDPGSPLVADALRYLMAGRTADGAWASTYTTAWSLMALNEVMKATGELAASYTFEAILNGSPLAQGQASGAQTLTPVTAEAPLQALYPDYPNELTLSREGGAGRLYYTVGLEVSRPVEDITPLSQGLSLARAVIPFGEAACPEGLCDPLQSAAAGQKVTVRLSLTVPHDAYYLAVSDYIPAGAEILDTSLKTSQLGVGGEAEVETVYDPRRPYAAGWGWWLFNAPQVYDDHITWTADYVPAGTYELTYTLVLLQPGQFRVLPARAWQLYFPEVQANTAGSVFEIEP